MARRATGPDAAERRRRARHTLTCTGATSAELTFCTLSVLQDAGRQGRCACSLRRVRGGASRVAKTLGIAFLGLHLPAGPAASAAADALAPAPRQRSPRLTRSRTTMRRTPPMTTTSRSLLMPLRVRRRHAARSASWPASAATGGGCRSPPAAGVSRRPAAWLTRCARRWRCRLQAEPQREEEPQGDDEAWHEARAGRDARHHQEEQERACSALRRLAQPAHAKLLPRHAPPSRPWLRRACRARVLPRRRPVARGCRPLGALRAPHQAFLAIP